MKSSTVSLLVDGERQFNGYQVVPEHANGAGIVLLQEIFGVNLNMRGYADDFARLGYTVIVPDIFWRQQPGLELDPAIDRSRALELLEGLDTDLAVSDSLLAAEHVRGLVGVSGRVGAVGYCLGGKLAYLMAMGTGIDAAVSYYGVFLQSLFGRMVDVRCPLLLHAPEQDHLYSRDDLDAMCRAAQGNDQVTVIRHPGVGHAFARSGSPDFDPDTTERANRATQEMLRSSLLGAK